MKKKIATRPISGFDELDAAGIGAGYRGMALEQATAPEAEIAPAGRTWGEAATDIGAGALKGALGVAQLGARVGDALTYRQGDENPAIRFLNEYGEAVDMQKSEKLRGEEQKAQQAIAAAGQSAKERYGDGLGGKLARFGAEFGTGAYEAVSNPTLLANSLAEQIPMMGAMKAGQKAAELLAKGATSVAPRAMATNVGKRIAGNAGLGGAVATGMALQGSDIKGETYRRMMELPLDMWRQNPEFVTLAKSIGEDAAKIEIAKRESSTAGWQSAGASLATSLLPGGTAMERALVGGKKIPLKAVPQSVAGEFTQESGEEGLGQLASNNAVAKINAKQDRMEGVGGAAGQGGAVGGILGGSTTLARVGLQGYADKKTPTVDPAIAAAQALADQQAAARKAAVSAVHTAAAMPNSPIARAAAAANPMTPEEAWAKAQELDAQAALDEVNGVAPVDPDTAPAAVPSGDPIDDTQNLIDASLAQAEQDKAAQRAAMGQPEVPAPQQSEQFPPAQVGDILNLQGKPFNTMAGAMLKLKRLGGGHEIVRVDGGLAIRPKSKSEANKAEPVDAPAQESTESVAENQYQTDDERLASKRAAWQALKATGSPDDVVASSVQGYQQKANATGKPMVLWKHPTSGTLGFVPQGQKSPFAGGEMVATIHPDAGVASGQGANANQAGVNRLHGSQIDKDWTAFHPESGTLNVPRAEMPQSIEDQRHNYTGVKSTGVKDDIQDRTGKEHLARNVDPMFEPEFVNIASVRSSGDNSLSGMGGEFRPISERHGAASEQTSFDREKGQRRSIQPRELRVGNISGAGEEQVEQQDDHVRREDNDRQGLGRGFGHDANGAVGTPQADADRKSIDGKAGRVKGQDDGKYSSQRYNETASGLGSGVRTSATATEKEIVNGVGNWGSTGNSEQVTKTRRSDADTRVGDDVIGALGGEDGNITNRNIRSNKSGLVDGARIDDTNQTKKKQPAKLITNQKDQDAQTAETFEKSEKPEAAAANSAVDDSGLEQPAAEPAGASPSEVDLTTVEGVARAVQLKVAANRRKSREKSRKEREAKGYAPNSTPESEQADYEAEISGPPSDLQKQSAAAMLGTDPLPLIQMFVHGQFDASEDVFKAITGVKIRGLSDKDKKAALYQWAKWTPEQIAQAEGDAQARKDEAAEKQRQDDLKSAVMGTWLGLDRLKVKEKDGTESTGQEFVLKSVASGFDKAHSQKKGAAVIYGLTDGARFTTLKAQEFTKFVKASIAFGGLDKALAYVNPPKPQAPEGFVDRSIATADSHKADVVPVEPVPQSAPAAPTPPTEPEAPAAPAPTDSAPSAKPAPRPKNWDKNYGAASKIAEAMGIALRGPNGKMKKVAELVAEIKSADTPSQPAVTTGDAQDLSKNQPKVDTSAEPVQKPAESGQVTSAQATLNRLLDPNDSPLANNLDSATHDVGIPFLKELLVKAKELKPGRTNELKQQHKRRLEYINAALLAKESGKPGLGVKREYQDEVMAKAETEWARTREVDRMAMMMNLGYSEEIARKTAGRNWVNVGDIFKAKLAKAMAEPLTPVAPTAPTGEDALYTSTAKLTQPYTLDDFIGNVDAGYRAHFDYAGSDGRTLWIERVEGGWVLKSKDDDSTTTITKGGAGAGGRWSKGEALRAAEDDAKFRYTEWKPVVSQQEGMFQTPAEKAAIEGKPIKGTNRKERIDSILSNGGKVVDGTLRTSNGLSMFKLTDVEAAAVPATQKDTSEDIKRRLQEVYPASAAELSPITKARNFLMELEAKLEGQGRVVDDRLVQMIRQQKAVIKELEAEQGNAPDLPSQEVSNTIQSSPSEDAIAEAKATIESLDAQIKRHEELLGCLG